MYTIEILQTIDSIKRSQWDAMATNPFSTYGWLKTIEDTYIGPIRPGYFLIKNRRKIVGAATTYIVEKDGRVSDIDDQLLGRVGHYASRLGFSFLPVLICGTIASFGQHLMTDPALNAQEKNHVIDRLLGAIVEYARNHGLPTCFTYLADHDRGLMRLLKKKGFSHTRVNPMSYLDIEWSSFDEYMDCMKRISKKKQKKMVYEINRNKKAGVRIEIEKEPEQYQERLFELINNNHIKHNRTPFYLKKEFIQKLQKHAGEHCRFYVSWKKGFITGTLLVIKSNKIQYHYAVGIDRELAGNDMTYFNICHYRPLMDAISNNTRRIDRGLGLHQSKVERGCKTGNYYFSYKSPGKLSNISLKPYFALLSMWYQEKNARNLKKLSGSSC
jgi:predicted N-acyltransferase